MSKGSVSKTQTPSKTSTKSKEKALVKVVEKKKDKPKSFSGRFEVMPDFRTGDAVPEEPETFCFEFRLMRRVLRWTKRHGVVREGILSMYTNHNDVERNKVWQSIDLAQSVVSFRSGDQRIMINTLEESPELFRLKLEDQKFKQCVKAFRQHRLFRQWKQSSHTLPKTPVRSTNAATSQAIKSPGESTTNPSIESLDAALAKLERLSNLESNATVDQVGKAQKEYLALARDVRKKIHSMLKSSETAASRPEPVKKVVQTTTILEPTPRKLQSPPPPSTAKNASPQMVKQKPKSVNATSVSAPKSVNATSVSAPKTLVQAVQVPKSSPVKSPKDPPAPVFVKAPEVARSTPSPPPPSDPIVANRVKSAAIEVAPPVSLFPKTSHVQVLAKKTPPSKDPGETSAEEEKHEKQEKEADDSDSEENLKSPAKAAVYRKELPAAMGPAPSLFKLLFSSIGRDINHLPLPTSAMEPLSMLQVVCEELEYSELIEHAIAAEDPSMRMANVAAFAVSAYGKTNVRSGRKPFSPLLGETFEFNSTNGWKYISEQVSHHPAVCACYAEGPGWQFWQDRQFLITFGGSSVEAKVIGIIHLHLDKWKETYRWNKVSSLITGILSGKQTMDHFGDLVISCEESNMTAKLHFEKSTKDSRGQIRGKIMDEDEDVVQKIHGNWIDNLYVEGEKDTKARRLWHMASLPSEAAKYYGFSHFAMSLNEMRPEIHGILPKTDSRFRPDLRTLEKGRPEEADKIKTDLENTHRQRKKEMDSGLRAAHKPLWFRETGNDDGSRGSRWQFTGDYWKAKAKQFHGCNIPKLW